MSKDVDFCEASMLDVSVKVTTVSRPRPRYSERQSRGSQSLQAHVARFRPRLIQNAHVDWLLLEIVVATLRKIRDIIMTGVSYPRAHHRDAAPATTLRA